MRTNYPVGMKERIQQYVQDANDLIEALSAKELGAPLNSTKRSSHKPEITTPLKQLPTSLATNALPMASFAMLNSHSSKKIPRVRKSQLRALSNIGLTTRPSRTSMIS
ncbi:hypothetical protein [Rubritalea tangerina]|uniref:hypothetical protein n=1 Tax=Rubritalea tangerina TaxID=430798 RepID=UPI00360EEDCC